ncbi:hypothetical protein MO973_09240 [Paenibacillus sp. TRM 82003]|nr:hypothetical protein [Paenibacillus sp. TRM 82003]
MSMFVLHAGQPELAEFLGRLRIPSGTALPRTGEGRTSWTIVSWRRPDDRSFGDASMRVLQPMDAVLRASDAKRRALDLRRHGLRSAEREPKRAIHGIARRFVIPVFQLDALGVFTSGGAPGLLGRVSSGALTEAYGPDSSPAAPRPAFVRRAERAAIRAVYVLGLDYAVVTVRQGDAGQPLIETVDPSPSVAAGPFAAAYAEAVNRLGEEAERERRAERRSTSKLLLGMDPEFVLRRPGPDGKIVSASRYFAKRGRVGCDSVRIGDKLVYPLAELRPSPSAEPKELFRNLYAAMRLAASRIDDASLEWLAGGMPARGLPLGGHIHVSGVPLNADLLRAMDNYMALPLVLLEDDSTKRRRPRYGALGDFRRQFHGGFEYRTLPSWIVSPKIAMGVIALAKVVCEHSGELRGRPLARPELQQAYYAGDKPTIQPIVEALWRDLERTASYAKYREPLDKFKRAVLRMNSWNEQADVRASWKIPPYRV